ncbi:Vam6/Vps39-like protein [Escovopsis weberi]|uniref:Vam6/Vps39-like protein n=1 Tax=Escovopsis weberi TaxID=150374 RepID=A0A0M8N3M6_ESCWE|nr:Vam6/Vps39-like protein [Escovopsis weberi]
MLSAFTARPTVELRQRDKSKIETILAYGDRILVGLNTGSLRVYRVNELHRINGPALASAGGPANATPPRNGDYPPLPPPDASNKPTDLLREIEKFSTRAIEQLAIIKEANTIVSLSNYHVSLHDLSTYELTETLTRTKNASCFAVTSNIAKDTDTGIPEIISRLAVAVKRRLLLWSWHESELADAVQEVVLSESIRTITWASATKLVCGMNGGFVMVDAETQAVEDIVSPGTVGATGQGSRFGAVSSAGMGYMGLGGYMPKPLATKLADGELLLAKDVNTLFVSDEGKPLERRQIPWQLAPDSIGYSYPYIVALQPPSKGSLEVRNPETLSLLQTIALPGAAQLHFPPPTVSLAHAGKGFHISSERCVWKMEATDYDSQVDELVAAERFDEAISILKMLEDALLKNKTETLREVKMLKAEALFRKKRYRQSMDLMNEDDVHAPPERVLRLYPKQISGELSKWADWEDKEESQQQQQQQQQQSADAVKRSSNGQRAESPDDQTDAEAQQNVGGFAKYWMGGQKKMPADMASIYSKREDGEDSDNVGRETGAAATAGEDRPLEGKELTKAVLELNSYLAGTRARLQRLLDPVTGKLKPKTDQPGSAEEAVDRLLRTSPDESDKELEEKLRNTFRLVDTTLFRAYMFSSPSLAGSLFRIPNFCDPDVVNERLLEHNRYTELVDFFHGKKLHKSALELLHRFGSAPRPNDKAPSLHGPDRTIQYLQSLPPSEIDLVLAHAGWTLRANPEYAMEIFVGDTENAETLPRDRVVPFLRGLDGKLELQYLEHIINELEDMTADFHNRLVELYVSSLKTAAGSLDWQKLMESFVRFLRESKQVYSLTKAFSLIPRDEPAFYEAQAVVLSNMGQHRQALEIYVFKMKDYVKAEETQSTGAGAGTSDAADRDRDAQASAKSDADPDDAASSIYHTLLSLYLQPPSPHKQNLGPALDLLSKHGARLPAASTVGLIPDELRASALEAYFRGRIRSANSLVNESRIVAGLRKAEGITVAATLQLGDAGQQPGAAGGRNRHVTITDERHCVVCHKKLGGGMRIGGSVIAVLTDNTVVHYGCLSRAAGGYQEGASRAPSWGRGL